MRVQGLLGSDIALQLDVCPPSTASRQDVVDAVERTTRWAERCLNAKASGQALFGIVQGGANVELRLRHSEELGALPLDGLALGGFSVGEPAAEMHAALPQIAPHLDPGRPRYLMGVGTPLDLVIAVRAGVDLFDCVIPTRKGRNGQAFTSHGRVVIKNARNKSDPSPLDPDCLCPACAQGVSRAYLRHLYVSGEILAHRFLTLHNLYFFQRLMQDCRAAIVGGSFESWSTQAIAGFRSGSA
jgi:queuine tRNA-ribosyltransferase